MTSLYIQGIIVFADWLVIPCEEHLKPARSIDRMRAETYQMLMICESVQLEMYRRLLCADPSSY